MKKVGFIGLGIMGAPMALNLLKAGTDLMVFDVNEAAVKRLAKEGAAAATKAEIAKECEIIFLILPNGSVVSDVLFGEAGLAAGLKEGTVVCDMSSVTPVESQECFEHLKAQGVSFVDAPVSGGEPGAVSGTLAIMAGGEPEAFETLKPYFEIMGSSALLIGGSGSGSITKLANQVIVNLTIATVSEAFVLASKAGADPEKVYHAIRGGLAGSAVLDAKIPMILERNFTPGGKISINYKDIKNVIDTAHKLDVPLPLTSQLFEILKSLKVAGHMNEDHGGIVQYFEALADTKVCRGGIHCPQKLKAEILDTLPAADEPAADALLREEMKDCPFKFIVLDDDPTGIQTVHGISVYTDWSKDSIRNGFAEKNSLFYILTNSRSMTKEQTATAHREIAETVSEIARETGQDYQFISRSDSTLRGHYPLETELLKSLTEQEGGFRVDGEILCFYFREGGRFTIDGVHYVKEQDQLVPAGLTEFAQDKTFGYRSSRLCDYIEEKTGGTYKADQVILIPLSMLRNRMYDSIEEKLLSVRDFNKIVVDAAEDCDLKVFCTALYRAMKKGKHFLFRTAASFVKVVGGISDRPLLARSEMIRSDSAAGGIIVVGSHTKKTTAQLRELLKLDSVTGIEFNSDLVLEGADAFEAEINRVVEQSSRLIAAGCTAVCYTKRTLLTLEQDTVEEALLRSVRISDGVQSLVGRLRATPAFVIAKGGITSSDIGTKALGVKRALVLGQIRPGIPVWQTDSGSRFPGIPYIIFPGNVGENTTLREAAELLQGTSNC